MPRKGWTAMLLVTSVLVITGAHAQQRQPSRAPADPASARITTAPDKDSSALPRRAPAQDEHKFTVRATPFGEVRMPAEAARFGPSLDELGPPPDLRARQEGDLVHLERLTPFGLARWTKSIRELDPAELRALERRRKTNCLTQHAKEGQ